MIPPSLPSLFLLTILFIKIYNVVAVEGGEGTYPLAAKEGAEIIAKSIHIPMGYYTFRHVETGKYLQFIDFQNQVVPTEGANNTVFNGTVWTVKWKGDKNYTIHHLNHANLDKCVSTRWDHTRGSDDAAVMWQCEVNNKTAEPIDFDIYPKFKGKYNASAPRPLKGGNGNGHHNHKEKRYVNTYEAIRPDKQQWLLYGANPSNEYTWNNVAFDPNNGKNIYHGDIIQPNRKKQQNSGSNLVYIVSAAHLWNMRSRCIYPKPSYVFDFTPNNTGVTNLDFCIFGNQSLVWEMTLWQPKDFPLGELDNPNFVHEKISVWAVLGSKAPSQTIILWSVLLIIAFLGWVCNCY